MYKKAQLHFKKTDPKLHKVSLEFEIEDLKQSNDLFRDIAWTIIGQQLSGKAADTIFRRFKTLFSDGLVTPEETLRLSDETMRGAGLSGAKTRAIRNLAEKATSKEVDLTRLPTLSDAEVAAELLKIKGIGPWTAEMILMFSLGRTDVFSRGDLGLQKGLMHLYGWKKLPSDKKLLSVIGKWSPYRTYAARILWRIADQKKMRIARKRDQNR
jgi:DNA-3-methyladenine glycosylase II